MLTANNITKKFAGVTALNNVSLSFLKGQVTAVIGENGAGKSTLMKILSGVIADYEGQLNLNEKPVRFASVREAQAHGIAIIHQELNLIPYLSITENVFLGRELTTRLGTLDRPAMRQQTANLLADLHLNLAPNTLVGDLKVGQQQVVEMAKALLTDADILIMDEPTSAISDSEVAVLFGIIRDLRKRGKAVVYISHKLDELFTIADRYVVLRDGKSVEEGLMTNMTHDHLIRAMVGRDLVARQREKPKSQKEDADVEAMLAVENLSLSHPVRRGDNVLKNLSLTVEKGEVVGLFGLMGAGRTELLETLFGLHSTPKNGTVRMNGQVVQIKNPAQAIRAGMALVPEDRKRDGLLLDLDVQTNISLTALASIETAGVLNRAKETALAEQYVTDLHIKTPSVRTPVRNLSGGNGQKVVLSKWLATKPSLLLLDEPTRGIDVHAKNELYALIRQLADQGMSILVASSEIPELLALADRILVLSEGQLTANIPIAQATDEVLLKAAITKSMSD